MFRGGAQRRGRGLSFPLVLLFLRVMSVGIEYIPPVTLFFLAVNAIIHLDILQLPLLPSFADACLIPLAVVEYGQYSRLLWSALFHATDMHLYYNLSSWLYKGRLLESRLGSESFLVATLVSLLGSSTLYVAISALAQHLHLAPIAHSYHACAVGFSAVLFSLKVILQATDNGPSVSYIMGLRIPSKYAYWVELVLIQLIAPQASLLGHLCGILVGLAYVQVWKTIGRGQEGAAFAAPRRPQHRFNENRFTPVAQATGLAGDRDVRQRRQRRFAGAHGAP